MIKLVAFIVLIGAIACGREPSNSATQVSQQSAAELPTHITRVTDPSQVCMVNDQFFGRPQIPIEVDGRTYYGCCAMCKEKLTNQPESRTARDPVSGEAVDKAKAVIVQDASGKVLYFASEATLGRYRG